MAADRCRLVIAEDHSVTGWGLAFLFSSMPDVEVVDHVTDGRELAGSLAQLAPDILILDVVLPGKDGLSLLEELVDRSFKIIVFSGTTTGDTFQRAFDLGADGLVTKGDPPDELIAAIEAVRHDQRYLSREVRRLIGNAGVDVLQVPRS